LIAVTEITYHLTSITEWWSCLQHHQLNDVHSFPILGGR
jgi:hypothetical protein